MKKDPQLQAEAEKLFFTKGREIGTREQFLDYVWNVVFSMSKGYSFSQIHSYVYSIIALQELNLNYFYPQVYWNCACLSVEASGSTDNPNKSISADYGEIAKAIYKMRQSDITVSAPDINQSDYEFTPVEETNNILFGLLGISGVNQKIAQQIISKRPYDSFKDFYKKHSYEGSLITRSKYIQLIKAGCFDSLEPDRSKVMRQYISLSSNKKSVITTQNLSEANRIDLPLPEDLMEIYQGRKHIFTTQFLYSVHPNFKSKKIYWLDEEGLKFFYKHLQQNMQEGVDYWEENDKILVVDKSIDKAIKLSMDKLKEYLSKPDVVKEYNKKLLTYTYKSLLPNRDPNHWSFEACSFYYGEHELAKVNRSKYDIKLFSELPENPVFIIKKYGKREWRQYEVYQIMGTVIARNDSHHVIYLLDTSNNVVNVKFDGNSYSWYKQQISDIVDGKNSIVDPSWFKRGQTLMLTGYRYGKNDFKVKTYKNSIYPHKVERIDKIGSNGSIKITSYRYGFEPEIN